MRHLLAGLLLFVSAATSGAQATLPDLLDMPAQPDGRALHGLMLDIVSAGERLVAVGEYGAILFSDDEGLSWNQAAVPVQVTLTAVHFPTPEKGWAVGHDGVILRSVDRGESWQLQLDGRHTGDLLLAAAEAWVAELEEQSAESDGFDEDLMLQQDAAMMALDEALREQEIGPNRPFMDVLFLTEKTGFAIGAFNYFFVTTDGGQTWQDGSPRLPNPDILHLYSIDTQEDGSLLMVGEFGLVLRSPSGKDWEMLSLDYEGTLFQVSSAAGRTWIAGLRGNVFYSDDLGESWKHMPVQVESSWLGARALPGKRATFAGLAGSLLQVGATQVVEYAQVARGHLAAVYVTKDGATILAGEGGLLRLEQDGQAARLQYLGEVN